MDILDLLVILARKHLVFIVKCDISYEILFVFW